ncbi:nascent polypeptide associated complex alpha subunit, putative [Ricinus communis]|uniref:Nascent polypeptide associated complex alpha subunit, putative n=1 Tax=Ricinus communis TaxID=3988 RepID=B9SX66_RICCO|nr:nascent polypeptide associated complex alpha subunit, putative [Ricinus communis]
MSALDDDGERILKRLSRWRQAALVLNSSRRFRYTVDPKAGIQTVNQSWNGRLLLVRFRSRCSCLDNQGANLRDEVGINPKDIELVMEQTGVSRSRAVEALKAANGDIVEAIMETYLETVTTKIHPECKRYLLESTGGNAVELYNKDMSKAKLDALAKKGHGGDHPNGSKRVRRAGFHRTRTKLAIRNQRHAVQPTPLLTGLKSHPSIYIRLGQRLPESNLVSQNNWTRAFKICSNAAVEYKRLLLDAGFGDFLSIQPFRINSGGYMSALVERYFSETHTLHLGTFEIGPTPLAWTMITGITFGGDPLNPPDITPEECIKLLGLVGTESEGFFSQGKLKLDVLCPLTLDFRKKPANSDLEWMFRRLILYLVGSCFFSGPDMMIPIRLVSAMSNIQKISQYDWGAATFSAFLRGMRHKTSECRGTFSGFYPFLLLWAYEHIPYQRPLTNFDPDIFPRARQWDLTKMDVPNSNDFTWYRLELEYLEEDEVNFDPYGKLWEEEGLEYERELSQKRIAFLGLESWELYMGERNLRQFGGGVRIPHSPPAERYGEGSQILTGAARKLLQGVDAWDLLEDKEYSYVEWFRANSLGRIVDLDQFQGRKILGGRLLELWLRVHQDGHKVISPQDLQELEDMKTMWKEKYQSTESKLKECVAEIKTLKESLDHWKGVALSRSTDLADQASNAEARVL